MYSHASASHFASPARADTRVRAFDATHPAAASAGRARALPGLWCSQVRKVSKVSKVSKVKEVKEVSTVSTASKVSEVRQQAERLRAR